MYNTKYFDGCDLWQLKPKQKAIHTYKISNGIILGMFQGNRGSYPELDFKIKILREGTAEVPEAPVHTYWVVDLIIKAQQYPCEINEILKFYIDFYNNCNPFNTVSDRTLYRPTTVAYMMNRYKNVSVPKTLPIDYIAFVIELFCICEKRNSGAYMFGNLLKTIQSYINGNLDYMHVIKASMPINRN